MSPGPELRTTRLLLRCFREQDLDAFAAMNADPEVCRYLPRTLTREQSAELLQSIGAHFRERGFGLWCVEEPGVVACAGWVGLSVPRFEAAFTPCVEVGWRLARNCWGRGYATEAAREALRFGFERLGLDEIVSFTVPANRPSRRVMERIGLEHDPVDDFDHPLLPVGHPLRAHVLYRIARSRSNPPPN